MISLAARVQRPTTFRDGLRAGLRFARTHPVAALLLLNLAVTFFVYMPFYEDRDGRIYLSFHGMSMDNIYRYYDGPLYIAVAKSLYRLGHPALSAFPDLDPIYYAAHFPGYPLTIRLFSYPLGYPAGMIAATIAATSLAIWVLSLLLKDLGLSHRILWLGFVFLFIPPRWLIYHSVGASEPLFILLFLAFILLYRREHYWEAGIVGGLAILTRSPAALILVAYLILVGWRYMSTHPRPSPWSAFRKWILPMLPFALAPLLLFAFYQHQFGDFFAYFHSGDNIHVTGAPFTSIWPSILDNNWSEATLWLYLLNAVGILLLWSRGRRDLAVFAAVYYLPLIFVAHHDLARYMMPIFPLTLLIGFESLISARQFKLALLLLIPAIYIYTWSGVQANLAPADEFQQLIASVGK